MMARSRKITPERIRAALEAALATTPTPASAYVQARDAIQAKLNAQLRTMAGEMAEIIQAYERADMELIRTYHPMVARRDDETGELYHRRVTPLPLRFAWPSAR